MLSTIQTIILEVIGRRPIVAPKARIQCLKEALEVARKEARDTRLVYTLPIADARVIILEALVKGGVAFYAGRRRAFLKKYTFDVKNRKEMAFDRAFKQVRELCR